MNEYDFREDLTIEQLELLDSESFVPGQETPYCRERKEFLEKHIQYLSDKDKFKQVFGEMHSGCEICNQCNKYDAKKCPMALMKLAEFYEIGICVPKNERIATNLMLKAANVGYIPAVLSSAEHKYGGLGCDKDVEGSIRLFASVAKERIDVMERVVEIYNSDNSFPIEYFIPYIFHHSDNGSIKMIDFISQLYERGGFGLDINENKVIYWLEKGAELEDINCMERLWSKYETKKDYESAYRWYLYLSELAPEKSDPAKLEELQSLMLLQNKSVDELYEIGRDAFFGFKGQCVNISLANRALSLAVSKGSISSEGLMGRILLEHPRNDSDIIEGIEFLKNSAGKDDIDSLYYLSILYIENNQDEFSQYYVRLIDTVKNYNSFGLFSDSRYDYVAAKVYIKNWLVPSSKSEIANLMLKAALDGLPEAEYEMGKLLEERNYTSVYDIARWWKKAAYNGFYEAKCWCARIHFSRTQLFDDDILPLQYFQDARRECHKDCLKFAYVALEDKFPTALRKEAYEILHRKAEEEDIESCRILCNKYFAGDSIIDKNYSCCEKYGELAIKLGDKSVRFNVAYAASALNHKERAKELYLELANEGNGAAMNNYACELEDRNDKLEWFIKSANHGDSYGYWNAGKLFRYGKDEDTDYDKALDYFIKASNLGHKYAMMELANMYRFGIGEKNLDKALIWYGKAADAGQTVGYIRMGEIYHLELDDRDNAVHCYKLAVENKEIEGYYKLGDLYQHWFPDTNDHIKKAIYWYRKGALLGNLKCKDRLDVLGVNWMEDKDGEIILTS